MSAGKIALFGCNRLGLQAASHLNRREYDFVLVDRNKTRVRVAQEQGFQATLVDYRDDEALRAIGIGQDIGTIFCFFAEDSENVFLTISARALDPKLKIVSAVESPEAEAKLRAAGADKIIDPYEISGRKIFELVKRPVVVDILDETVFGRHDLKMAEIEIPQGSPVDGKRVSELGLDVHYNLILLGVVDKEHGKGLRFVTGRIDYKLDSGDILVVLGPSREILAFKRDIRVN